MSALPARRAKALLLAAGRGTRLGSLSHETPKCLVPIGGRPLLDYWLELMAKADVREALINTHHLREQVVAYLSSKERGVRVVEAYEPELLGSVGTVRANRSWMDDADDCLIIYADNFSDMDLGALLGFHRAHGAPLTMALFRAPDPRQCGIASLDADGWITSFVEKPENPRGDLANSGLLVARAECFREIADMGGLDLGHDILPRFIGRMKGWLWSGYHRDIGTPQSLNQARSDHARIGGEHSGELS